MLNQHMSFGAYSPSMQDCSPHLSSRSQKKLASQSAENWPALLDIILPYVSADAPDARGAEPTGAWLALHTYSAHTLLLRAAGAVPKIQQ